MKCYEITALLTVSAVAPYVIEAASRWLRAAVKRCIGASAPI